MVARKKSLFVCVFRLGKNIIAIMSFLYAVQSEKIKIKKFKKRRFFVDNMIASAYTI